MVYNIKDQSNDTFHFPSIYRITDDRNEPPIEIKDSIVLKGHSLYVNKCVVSIKHDVLFTASTDSTIRVWNLDKQTCIGNNQMHAILINIV